MSVNVGENVDVAVTDGSVSVTIDTITSTNEEPGSIEVQTSETAGDAVTADVTVGGVSVEVDAGAVSVDANTGSEGAGEVAVEISSEGVGLSADFSGVSVDVSSSDLQVSEGAVTVDVSSNGFTISETDTITTTDGTVNGSVTESVTVTESVSGTVEISASGFEFGVTVSEKKAAPPVAHKPAKSPAKTHNPFEDDFEVEVDGGVKVDFQVSEGAIFGVEVSESANAETVQVTEVVDTSAGEGVEIQVAISNDGAGSFTIQGEADPYAD